MSMNPEQQNFDQLRRLLKLKRYEQPHPRYFNDFSGQVIARIRVGEGGQATAGQASWLVKFWSLFEAKPMVPGAIGVALCALLVFVAAYAPEPGPPFPGTPTIPSAAVPILNPELVENHATALNSTNPVIQLGSGSLFDQFHPGSPTLISQPFRNN